MTKKIKSELNNVTIGTYVVGDNTVIHPYHSEKKDSLKEKEISKNKTVFLSYNWNDEEIADKIDSYLSRFPNITVKRDKREIGVWESIKKHMESIREENYAVFIISDFFLKAENCMFEVLEMMKEKEYKERIFPAVVERKIYDPLARAEYIEYWQQKCEKVENTLKRIESVNSGGLVTTLKKYKSIAFSIDEFLTIVADMNNPNIQEVEIQIEKAIQKKK